MALKMGSKGRFCSETFPRIAMGVTRKQAQYHNRLLVESIL